VAPLKAFPQELHFPFVVLCTVLLAWPPLARSQDFSGKVVGVLDGDTIEVLHNKKPQRVRLYGIDCPEKGQAFGNRAKQATSELVFGRRVTIETHGHDKYTRTIGDVLLSDGTRVNRELVAEGWCWWYRKYAPEDVILAALEAAAQVAQKGLWVDPNPIPPWEFRRQR
jgi:micrococcal nuclease